MINLTHQFKDTLPDVDEFFLFKNGKIGIYQINSYCNHTSSLAEKYGTNDNEKNNFKGDSLELLIEFLIKRQGGDNRIGITDYQPVPKDEDFGVDGIGKGINGNPATVQSKFHVDSKYILTANKDGLSNFLNASCRRYKVKQEDDKNMLIITTGLKVDERTMENMLYNSVRVLNRENLRSMLDNLTNFWLEFYESVKMSRIKTKKLIPKILREHQIEAVVSTNKETKGIVISPTGTGKTLEESEIIKNVILESLNNDIVPYIKVNSSRILLCFQLFDEVFNYLNALGINARYINFNSGKKDETKYIEEVRSQGITPDKIISTTNPNEVSSIYFNCRKKKLPLIVFSTYHSSEKLSMNDMIPDLTIHDESHNLVRNEFWRVAQLSTRKQFFFTATPRYNENGDLGMDNKEIFGNVLYQKSPKYMIDKGEMVPPLIHRIKPKKGQSITLEKIDKDYDAILNSIIDGFFAHEKWIKERSSEPLKIGAKILVVCRGQEDLMEMINKTETFKKFKIDFPDIHVYALSSTFGVYYNGEQSNEFPSAIKKQRMLKKVKDLNYEDRAIIFHVEMIGEGIDIPNLTGVMPIRNLGNIPFNQNIGRCARLHPIDRIRLYSNKINVEERNNTWIKPAFSIIIPDFLENSEGFADKYEEIIKDLRTNYGFDPSEQIFIDNVRGIEEDEEISTVNKKEINRRHTDSGLEEFEHEIEDLSVLDKVDISLEYEKECKKYEDEFDALISNI